jgi:ankyrin repeat protein
MGSQVILETPYIAAMNGEWQRLIDYYQEHFEYLYSPVTLSLDTGFHLAVHSNEEQPLKDLLEIVKENEYFVTETGFFNKQNKFGNTALHEATIYGNYKAARLLVECFPDLLKEKNKYGETPLFTAAGFAKAEIVELLILTKPELCVDNNCRLSSIHCQRLDGLSILSAAIIGQHFGNNFSFYRILKFKSIYIV